MIQADTDVTMTSPSISKEIRFLSDVRLASLISHDFHLKIPCSSSILVFRWNIAPTPCFLSEILPSSAQALVFFWWTVLGLGGNALLEGKRRWLAGQTLSCSFSAWACGQKSNLTPRSKRRPAPPCSTHKRQLRSWTFPASPEPPPSSARWLLTDFNYDSQELIWLLAVYPPLLPSMEANYAWVAMDERWTLLLALPLPLCSHYWGIWVVKWDHNWLLCHHWLCYKTLWARTQ